MLKVISLYLKNFMCISEAELDFNANCIIIEGDNGQGKSAIMEAVAICLSERKRSDSVKEFVQKGYDHAKIVLDLIYNNEDIHFDVTLNVRGGTPLERDVLYRNKHYINSEVTELIKSLEFTFYSDIIISMQGSDDIAVMTPTTRLNLLQKLFQFDFSEHISPIEAKIDELYKNKVVNSERIDFFEKANKKNKEVLKSLLEQTLEFSKDQYDSFKEEVSKIKKELDNINDSIEKSNNILKLKVDKIDTINKLETSKKELQLKLSENEKAVYDISQLNYDNKLKSYSENSSVIKNEIEDISKNISSDNDKLLDLRKKHSSIIEVIATKKALKKDYNKKIDLINKGICPECGQSTLNLDITKINNDKQNNEEELLSLDKSLKEIENEEINIQNDIDILRKELGIKNNNVYKINSDVSTLKTIYEKLKKEVISNDELFNIENKIKDLNNKIDDCKQLIISYDSTINESNKILDKRTQLKDRLNLLTEKITSYDKVNEHNNIVSVQKLSINNSILENENNIAELKNSISQIDMDIQTYSEVLKILGKELPNYLVVKTCARLEQEMNNFVNVVFPQFKIRLLQSKRGVEFFYTTKENTDMTDLKRLINSKMASGYEKSVLSLAFKVALCKAYNLSFIALDEIDAAASEGNSILTIESIIGSNIFNQIFFITHKEATRDIVKSLCDSTISYHVSKGVFSNEEAD